MISTNYSPTIEKRNTHRRRLIVRNLRGEHSTLPKSAPVDRRSSIVDVGAPFFPRPSAIVGVMISGGLRFYNARLAIGGFVSTVRSYRADRVVAILRLASLFLPNFSFFTRSPSLAPFSLFFSSAVRFPSPFRLPALRAIALIMRKRKKERKIERERERGEGEFVTFVVGLCRRVDDEIFSSRRVYERSPSLPRISCVDLRLVSSRVSIAAAYPGERHNDFIHGRSSLTV